jgi:hypothetical protein
MKWAAVIWFILASQKLKLLVANIFLLFVSYECCELSFMCDVN